MEESDREKRGSMEEGGGWRWGVLTEGGLSKWMVEKEVNLLVKGLKGFSLETLNPLSYCLISW